MFRTCCTSVNSARWQHTVFEGQGNAVLYTGDIRAEPWWVNNITRNPFMIEYSSGLKKLDCMYLDTSNTKSIDFPTKADGLRELLQKVSKYPKDTVFHISSWTFGYEEVWMTLSKALNSPVNLSMWLEKHTLKSIDPYRCIQVQIIQVSLWKFEPFGFRLVKYRRVHQKWHFPYCSRSFCPYRLQMWQYDDTRMSYSG